MKKISYPRGVLAPAVTPFHSDLSIDMERFGAHCHWLLQQGVKGLAIFGTTSEATSLSCEERMHGLDGLLARGVPAACLLPGTGCSALTDTVTLTRHAVQRNCGGVLLLPPFYYKGVSENGVFSGIAELIERVADTNLRLFLYHIPALTGVPFTVPLVERLIKAYPSIILGLKDSSGDWNNTKSYLDAFPGFAVYSGNESYMLETLRLGGAGSISATANVNAAGMRRLLDAWQTPEADQIQQEVTLVRKTIQPYSLMAATKAILAHYKNDPEWNRLRPPLEPLTVEASRALCAALDNIGFSLK